MIKDSLMGERVSNARKKLESVSNEYEFYQLPQQDKDSLNETLKLIIKNYYLCSKDLKIKMTKLGINLIQLLADYGDVEDFEIYLQQSVKKKNPHRWLHILLTFLLEKVTLIFVFCQGIKRLHPYLLLQISLVLGILVWSLLFFGYSKMVHAYPINAPMQIINECPDSSFSYRNANLSGAVLGTCDLSSSSLYKSDLTGADLHRVVSLKGMRGQHVNLDFADLHGVDLSGSDLRGASLIGANLIGTDLSGADLSGSNLTGALLIEANLSNATLDYAKIERVSAQKSQCISTSFKGATIYGSSFKEADLINADFSAFTKSPWLNKRVPKSTKLIGIDFSLADLRQSKLDRALMRGINLEESKTKGMELTCEQLKGVLGLLPNTNRSCAFK